MLKKALPWFVFALLGIILVVGFAAKDKLNNYISKIMKEQATPEEVLSGEALVDSLYNYTKSGAAYEVTFLEFGALNCAACKQMETVMEQVKHDYATKINVVFINTMLPENMMMVKHFAIAAIPTQVLLNKDGEEIFRHVGAISKEELVSKLFTVQKEHDN